jgi:hypothetical protein
VSYKETVVPVYVMPSVPFVFVSIFLLFLPALVSVVYGHTTVYFSNNDGTFTTFNAPLYRFSDSSISDYSNISVVVYPVRSSCSKTLSVQTTPAVLLAINPLCYPEVLAARARSNNFTALIVGNGICSSARFMGVVILEE